MDLERADVKGFPGPGRGLAMTWGEGQMQPDCVRLGSATSFSGGEGQERAWKESGEEIVDPAQEKLGDSYLVLMTLMCCVTLAKPGPLPGRPVSHQ